MTKYTHDAEIATLKEAQKNMAEKIDDLNTTVNDGFDRVMNKFDSLDDKFASKLTEKIVYGLVSLILFAVVTALVALVVR
ncbi:hypothetical protein MASR2M39_30130 [Ignavibacteriales bacterium]